MSHCFRLRYETDLFAKVIVESPLPQLDRVFEFEVPERFDSQIAVGVRVKVSIGNSKKLYDAFVVGLTSTASYNGKLSQIAEIVSSTAVLTGEIFELLSDLSQRQVSPIGEILKLAIPNRSVKVEDEWLARNLHTAASDFSPKASGARSAWLVSPIGRDGQPPWVEQLVSKSLALANEGSVIVCLPDQADVDLLLDALLNAGAGVVNVSSSQSPSKRYASFLYCLESGNRIIVGNRSSLLTPCRNLAGIIVWNDSDFSHVDQGSPYLHSRDLALLRQSKAGGELVFASYGISTEVMRLISLGYLELVVSDGGRPKLSYEQQSERAESLALNTIKKGLAAGPVLVQVSALGNSVAVYCKNCNHKMHCRECAGPLWLNSKAQPVCRWCNALNFGAKCLECGDSEIRQGRSGSTRSVAELGKMFPGVRVIEASSSNRILKIDDKPLLVVATPGAEPITPKGYQAIVLLDASNQLAKDSLRSVEDAVSAWNGAISLLHPEGQGVLVGVGGKLAEQYVLWKQLEISREQYQDRQELGLPPAIRLGSISGNKVSCKEVSEVAKSHGAEVLGPTALDPDNDQYLFKYKYSAGMEIAAALKAATLKVGAGLNAKTSKMQRSVRIKMDDRQVI